MYRGQRWLVAILGFLGANHHRLLAFSVGIEEVVVAAATAIELAMGLCSTVGAMAPVAKSTKPQAQ
jgi:hypothetical protein